jgi:hypothetical protein
MSLEKDMLESLYGNMGGKVFDLNHELNKQGMVMFKE